MLYARCIEKIRENNEIKWYKLKDNTGMIVKVEPIKLRVAMSRGLIEIENLKITADGRIIDKVKPRSVLWMRCIGQKFNQLGQVVYYKIQNSNGDIKDIPINKVISMVRENPKVIENIRLDSVRGLIVQY